MPFCLQVLYSSIPQPCANLQFCNNLQVPSCANLQFPCANLRLCNNLHVYHLYIIFISKMNSFLTVWIQYGQFCYFSYAVPIFFCWRHGLKPYKNEDFLCCQPTLTLSILCYFYGGAKEMLTFLCPYRIIFNDIYFLQL